MKKYLIMSVVIIISACSNTDEEDIEITKVSATVKDCEIWFVENSSSSNGQKRMRVFAATSAQVGLERAATASYIALKAIELTNYDHADIFLVPIDAERDRNELYGGNAVAYVRYAPLPEKIPFMTQSWEIEYKIGETTKVIDEYGHKEYEFETPIKLTGGMTLDVVDNNCDASKIADEVRKF